jgi:hypothetical protein
VTSFSLMESKKDSLSLSLSLSNNKKQSCLIVIICQMWGLLCWPYFDVATLNIVQKRNQPNLVEKFKNSAILQRPAGRWNLLSKYGDFRSFFHGIL